MKFLIGTDPELFIYNKITNKVVSAIPFLPGTKDLPYKPHIFSKGFAVQTDNILAEFNVPPTNNINEFVLNLEMMKTYIKNYVQQFNPDLDILCQASAQVDESELQSEQAKMFGCSPDYNVYTEEPNPMPNGQVETLRTTGMHIHVGTTPVLSTDNKLLLLRLMDLYLGLPSLLFDTDTERRNLYGKAGCFRLTPYGVEYRVLSGYFLKTKALEEWVFKNTYLAINKLVEMWKDDNTSWYWNIIDNFDIQSIINNNQVKKAEEIITNILRIK